MLLKCIFELYFYGWILINGYKFKNWKIQKVDSGSEVELFYFSMDSKYFKLKQNPPPSPSSGAFEQASFILKSFLSRPNGGSTAIRNHKYTMISVMGIPNNWVMSSPSVQSNYLHFYLTIRDPFVYPAFPNRKWKSGCADMWENGHQFHRGSGGQSNRWGMTTKQPLEAKEREGHAH